MFGREKRRAAEAAQAAEPNPEVMAAARELVARVTAEDRIAVQRDYGDPHIRNLQEGAA